MSKLKDIAYITKLAGFEHKKYIQGNCTQKKQNDDDKPLFIGKTVRNGNIDKNFDWFISSKISEELPRSQLNKKCIVLPYVGSVGDLAIFDGTYKAHLGSNIAKLELNDNCEFSEEFIYYYLKSPFGQKNLLKDIQGAVQKNITMDAIRNVEIPNIEKSKQTKIVNMLLGLDKKILNNNNIISELESMAKTIYDYWFLQYEFPNEEEKPYRSSGGKMVYNNELKKEIPEGWKVSTIGNVIIEKGKSPIQVGDAKDKSGKYPFFTSGSEIYEVDEFITEGRNCYLSTGGKGYVQYYVGKSSYSTDTWVISGIGDLEDYLYLFIKSIEDMLDIKYFAGTGLKHLQKDLFKNTHIVIPNEKILKRFNVISNKIFNKISKIYKENKELQKTRDYLLPLLMNGQVSFKD